MFVKIENYYCENYPLFLNVNLISEIYPSLESIGDNSYEFVGGYVEMNNKNHYNLTIIQYEQLCEILTKRL